MSTERRMQQRLEAWMADVTASLCYQPEIPQAHKEAIAKSLDDYIKQGEYERAAFPTPPADKQREER